MRSAAHAIASDIELVTTSKPSIITALNNNNRFLIIAGTIGKSVVIDELVKSKKLDISKNSKQVGVIYHHYN